MMRVDFEVERAPRPILARDADSTYWMSRYVERAENVARMLLVSVETLVDVKDLAPALLERQWESVLRVMSVESPAASPEPVGRRVSYHMTFREENPSSLVSCLTRARENARGIREGISTDMWEHLNTLYWGMRADEAVTRFHETPAEFYRQVVAGAMTFHGLADQTLPHDQRWQFARLGRHFERVAFTCRTMEERAEGVMETGADSALRNVQGITLLRCCNSLEAYRRAYPGEVRGGAIAGFLLLEPSFPRSVRHCIGSARQAAAAIREEVRPRGVDEAERILGRLQARLDYAEVGEVLGSGLREELAYVQREVARAALAVQKSYFLH